MGMRFMELISVGYEKTKYLINRFVLQEMWEILLGRVPDSEELVETVSGSEGRS